MRSVESTAVKVSRHRECEAFSLAIVKTFHHRWHLQKLKAQPTVSRETASADCHDRETASADYSGFVQAIPIHTGAAQSVFIVIL
jgi:hypothetical protein